MLTHEHLLGRTVRDKLTGFTGVVTGYIYYMTGCNQVLATPKASPTGDLGDSKWFDVQRLEVDQNVERIVLDNADTPGFLTPPRPEH
jgi:hypothetical protein